jgi:hypothetical protein
MARGMRCGLRSWWQLAWRGPSSGREGAGGHQGSSTTPPDRPSQIDETSSHTPTSSSGAIHRGGALYAPAFTLPIARIGGSWLPALAAGGGVSLGQQPGVAGWALLFALLLGA